MQSKQDIEPSPPEAHRLERVFPAAPETGLTTSENPDCGG